MTRENLLKEAVIEAARELMAAELRLERGAARDVAGDAWLDLVSAKEQAWQTLRDSLTAERSTR